MFFRGTTFFSLLVLFFLSMNSLSFATVPLEIELKNGSVDYQEGIGVLKAELFALNSVDIILNELNFQSDLLYDEQGLQIHHGDEVVTLNSPEVTKFFDSQRKIDLSVEYFVLNPSNFKLQSAYAVLETDRKRTEINNANLNCVMEEGTSVIDSCITEGSITVDYLINSNLRSLMNKVLIDFITNDKGNRIDDLNLTLRNGRLRITAHHQVSISINGQVVHQLEDELIKVRIKSAYAAGLFSIKSRLLKEVRKHESPNLWVEGDVINILYKRVPPPENEEI